MSSNEQLTTHRSTTAESSRYQGPSSDQQNAQQQKQRRSQLKISEQPEKQNDPLQWSRILISMASMGIAAYFLTSGIMQIAFAQFGVSLCAVNFSKDDPSPNVTWLVASCWLVGLLRLLLSVCIGRPPYNRSVRSTPSAHEAFIGQMAALEFLPDVQPRSRDMSVLDRAQLAAGIIHPSFYHRTLLVAWQEGLLVTLWLILHLMRLLKLSEHFRGASSNEVWLRDELLNQAFSAIGSNFTAAPLQVIMTTLKMDNYTWVVNMLKSTDTLNKLACHTCELVASCAASVFYWEDICLLCLLATSLLLLPMLSRMLKFFYNR